MTTPSPPPEQAPPLINVAFELQPGPDGQPWVKCTIQCGLSSFAFLANEEQADQLAGHMATGFGQGAAAIRRNRLGLVVATPDMVPGTNGHHPT